MNEAPDNNENVSSEVSGRNQDRTAKTSPGTGEGGAGASTGAVPNKFSGQA